MHLIRMNKSEKKAIVYSIIQSWNRFLINVLRVLMISQFYCKSLTVCVGRRLASATSALASTTSTGVGIYQMGRGFWSYCYL